MRKNIIPGTAIVRNQQGGLIASSSYRLDINRGTIRGASGGGLPNGAYTITYEYYPVYDNPYILGSPFVAETKDAEVFDGVTLGFQNDWFTNVIDSASGWVGKNAYVYNFTSLDVNLGSKRYVGYRKPSDYQFQFSDRIVDTSSADPELFPFKIPADR